jgi:hypothetical protein
LMTLLKRVTRHSSRMSPSLPFSIALPLFMRL